MKNIKHLAIDSKIVMLRGRYVMIDKDIASLYDIKTKRLNEQVKRNIEKFPADFMFQLNQEEKNELIAKHKRLEGLKYSTSNPYVFTEHGVYMLATVLTSKLAAHVSISMMRTFSKLSTQSLPSFDLEESIDVLESNDKSTDELLSWVFK